MEYVYGALLLHKLGKPVDAEHLGKVIKATGVEPDEAKIKTLIASLHGVDIAQELANASTAVVSAGPVEAKEEEKKEEEKPVESAAGLASLFG
ncbi:MAG: 50S ribosomal protein L12 [Nanoarchaeota archaeon]